MLLYLAYLIDVTCSSGKKENYLISARNTQLSHAVEAFPICACAPCVCKQAGVSEGQMY